MIDKFYTSNLKIEIYEETLKNNRKIDISSSGCAIGPHKSDYMFYVNDNSFVSQLSTGQQKTIILLIDISMCPFSEVKFKTAHIIVMLDEVCSHLLFKQKSVIDLIETFKLQIFMTGTSGNLFSLSTNANFCNITD